MKVWTSIAGAVAILALAASAGNAANSMIPVDLGTSGDRAVLRAAPSGASGTALVIERLTAKNKGLVAKNKALKAESRALNAEIRRLNKRIADLEERLRPKYDPPVVPVPVPDPDPDADCRDYVSNCTPEQDCRYWGNNCHLVTQSDDSAGESSPEPVEPQAPLVEELPAELTGEVGSGVIEEFDYSVYDWEG